MRTAPTKLLMIDPIPRHNEELDGQLARHGVDATAVSVACLLQWVAGDGIRPRFSHWKINMPDTERAKNCLPTSCYTHSGIL